MASDTLALGRASAAAPAPSEEARSAVKLPGDRVPVPRGEPEEPTSGAIIPADAARNGRREGEAVAVASGGLLGSGGRARLAAADSDVIVHQTEAGTEVRARGDDLAVLDEGSIPAVRDQAASR